MGHILKFLLGLSSVIGYCFISVHSETLEVICDADYVTTNKSCHMELCDKYDGKLTLGKMDKIEIVKPKEISFDEIKDLQVLCDSGIAITEFPLQMFEKFPNVNTLGIECQENMTKIFQTDSIYARNLTELKIVFWNLAKIEPHALQSFTNLIEIYLNWNGIDTVDDYAFDGLTNLRLLSLVGNLITKITPFTFSGLPSIEHLNLDTNRIDEIADGAFNLPKLKTLDLSSNSLKTLSDFVFAQAPVLSELQLKFSKIEHINNALYSLNHLEKLQLSENKLVDLDLTKIAKLPNLKELEIDDTDFNLDAWSVSASDIAAINSKLEAIDLSYNKLSTEIIFEKLKLFPNLKTVKLEYNELKKFDLEKIRSGGFSKLSTIHVKRNPLDTDWLKTKFNELSIEWDDADVEEEIIRVKTLQ